jgi:hypothetical protein
VGSTWSAFLALSEYVVLSGDVEKLVADFFVSDPLSIATNPPRFIAQALSVWRLTYLLLV